jgi:hypothetical protein
MSMSFFVSRRIIWGLAVLLLLKSGMFREDRLPPSSSSLASSPVIKSLGRESFGCSPIEGRRAWLKPLRGIAEAGVLRELWTDGRSTAVVGSSYPPGVLMADSAIGVGPAAIGVAVSPPAKYLDLPPNEVISLSDDDMAKLR